MTTSLLFIVALYLCALAFFPPAADAAGIGTAGGRIEFSGAIVEPTCGIPAAYSTIDAVARSRDSPRQGCSDNTTVGAGASRVYALTSERLSSATSDRVLKYFDGYVRAGSPNAADPVLLTRTYE